MAMKRMLWAGIIVGVVLGSRPAAACSCVSDESTGAKLLAEYEAVFVGEVVLIRLVEHPGAKTERGYAVYQEQEIKFRVWKAWKGVSDSFVTLRTGGGGGDCGYTFHPGYRYVVFARSGEAGMLQTSICTRTVQEAGQGDLLMSMGPPSLVHEHNVGFEQF
jgi:hypothetical protein